MIGIEQQIGRTFIATIQLSCVSVAFVKKYEISINYEIISKEWWSANLLT